MKLGVYISFLLITLNVNAQLDSLFYLSSETNRENSISALVAYYFWEEDSSGFIIDSTFQKNFKRNYSITFKDSKSEVLYPTSYLQQAIIQFSEDNSSTLEKSKFEISTPSSKEKIQLSLLKNPSKETQSLIFCNKEMCWQSYNQKNVIYLNVLSDSRKQFSHSSDSVNLSIDSISQKAFGHYLIKRFWNEKGQIVAEEVYAFNGENVTSYFTAKEKPLPKHVLIFSNGYRGPKKNKDVTDDMITKKDRFHYWLRLDKAFVNRIKPDDYFYIDGNNKISTSNHRTMANFSLSYSRIKALRKREKNKNEFQLLNANPNDEGFFERKEKGRIAGKTYLIEKCNSPACIEVKDTLDFVCHSMGYAYALGFLEEIQDFVFLRNMYIIAPENACAGGFDWTLFQEVWQYGSNLDQENPDPVWQQDGIAPQCEVKDLQTAKVGGRIFFPENEKGKNFINSHMLNHYRWIFKDLKMGDRGFVY
ncbi:MAG: hypothetical protein V4622_07120 [Bacteroidota bacterium]